MLLGHYNRLKQFIHQQSWKSLDQRRIREESDEEEVHTQQEDEKHNDSEDDCFHYRSEQPPQDTWQQACNAEDNVVEPEGPESPGAHDKQGGEHKELSQRREATEEPQQSCLATSVTPTV